MKLLIGILIWGNVQFSWAASGFECGNVRVKLEGQEEFHSEPACFSADFSLWHSLTCHERKCGFDQALQKLTKRKGKIKEALTADKNETVGAHLCKALGGTAEKVDLYWKANSLKSERCMLKGDSKDLGRLVNEARALLPPTPPTKK